MSEVSRDEHLVWCKKRALEYLERGDVQNAYASMGSDMSKHPDTAGHPAILLGAQLFFAGHLNSVPEMRKFIEGFH